MIIIAEAALAGITKRVASSSSKALISTKCRVLVLIKASTLVSAKVRALLLLVVESLLAAEAAALLATKGVSAAAEAAGAITSSERALVATKVLHEGTRQVKTNVRNREYAKRVLTCTQKFLKEGRTEKYGVKCSLKHKKHTEKSKNWRQSRHNFSVPTCFVFGYPMLFSEPGSSFASPVGLIAQVSEFYLPMDADPPSKKTKKSRASTEKEKRRSEKRLKKVTSTGSSKSNDPSPPPSPPHEVEDTPSKRSLATNQPNGSAQKVGRQT